MAAEPSLVVGAWPARSNRRGNPYNYLLAESLERLGAVVQPYRTGAAVAGRFDVIHLHWPDWLLDHPSRRRRWGRGALFLAALAVARRRGTRIVWSVHNLGGHEAPGAGGDTALWRRFTSMVDAFIVLSPSGEDAARRRFPGLAGAPCFVVPHGHYRGEYPPAPPRDRARAALGLPADAAVLLAFGHLRTYKRPVELVRAFREVADPSARLVVAGRPIDRQLASAVEAAAEGDDRVVLRLGFVERADVSTLFGAADLCVLPYTADAQNSGAAMLSLSFDRPVLAPPTGGFADLQEVVGAAWIRLVPEPAEARALEGALREAVALRGAAPDLEPFDWDAIGEATMSAYRQAARA